jgi:hypothetical protein
MKISNPLTAAPELDSEEGHRNVICKTESLEKTLARLSESIHEAISKCHPYLVSDPRNSITEDAPVPTRPMSPHAHYLDSLNDKIWDLGTLVQSFSCNID